MTKAIYLTWMYAWMYIKNLCICHLLIRSKINGNNFNDEKYLPNKRSNTNNDRKDVVKHPAATRQ